MPAEGDTLQSFLTECPIESESDDEPYEIRERGDEGALAADILNDLNTDSIRSLKRNFITVGGEDGVQEGEFVKMMLAYLLPGEQCDYDPDEELDRVGKLKELFAEIDVNGDGTMQWEEFTEFLIDAGMVSREEMSVDAVKKYHPSPLVDNDRHADIIEQIRYFPQLDKIAVLEHRSLNPKVYRAENCALQKSLAAEHIQSVLAVEHCFRQANTKPIALPKNESKSSLGEEPISSFSYLVTAGGDCRLNFWDSISCNSLFHIPTGKEHVTTMCFFNDRLYTGSRAHRFGPQRHHTAGFIHHWDIDNMRDGGIMGKHKVAELCQFDKESDLRKHVHTEHVMGLCGVDGMEVLCSAGMDARIGMWDCKAGVLRKWLEKKDSRMGQPEEQGHSQGVTSLAYNSEYRMIFSAGFDTHCFVWNPIVEKCIFRMEGHTSPLVGVRVVPDTPQIITGDRDGYLRLWDIRNFRCVQKWRPSATEMSCFEVIPKYRKVVVGGKKMHFFESEKTVDVTVTDVVLITAALYNPIAMSFCSISERSLKIWSAVTGRVTKIYHDVSSSEITCMCLDSRCRKIIFGNAEGEIRVVNYNNGVVMKSIQGHSRDVSGVVYCVRPNESPALTVASCSWDLLCKTYDEEDPEFFRALRVMDGHEQDVTCVAYSDTAGLLLTGSVDFKNNNVRLWDLATAQREQIMFPSHLPGHVSEIVACIFLGQLNIAVAADAAGIISFTYTKPSPRGCMQFFFFDTETELAYDEATSPPLRGRQFALSCLGYDEQSECLVTGDEEGRIRLWELKIMLDQLEKMNVFPKELRDRIQAAKGQEVPLDERHKICDKATCDAQGSGMVVVTKDCIRLKHKWIAHKDVIKSLQVVAEPNVIVTVGMDRRVHVWAVDLQPEDASRHSGTKLGTLLQGVGLNQGWKFGMEYERVAREREAAEELHVKELINEVREIEVPVDISVPPPTPPARSLLNDEGYSNSSRPATVPSNQQSPQASMAARSATSLSGLFPKGRDLGMRNSPSRISLARKQQLQAIDPLRAASLYPKHKGSITPFNRTQDIAARGVQDAINDAMQGLYDRQDNGGM